MCPTKFTYFSPDGEETLFATHTAKEVTIKIADSGEVMLTRKFYSSEELENWWTGFVAGCSLGHEGWVWREQI